MLPNRCFLRSCFLLFLLLAYGIFLVWKQSNLEFSAYNSLSLVRILCWYHHVVVITNCTRALGAAAYCSGRLSSRQFTLN